MTASLYQGQGNYTSVVGKKMKTKLPGPIHALKQGSEGPTMSDMQFMMENERKQHEDAYRYAHGSHASDNVPLGKHSF
ncbi:MAG: hypothetical protein LLF94_05655 [Chlamydiales bacterium]|nr:hypothetical protein [Chlamydiales bacterium]